MSEPRWITLNSRDPDYLAYLRGTFSESLRAMPMHRQVEMKSQKKGYGEVVFQLRPLSELQSPQPWKVWLQAVRWSYLTFSLSPMLAALAMVYAKDWSMNFALIMPSLIGVLLLQIAAHFFNDYYDHIKGVDHVRWRGNWVLQKGWLPAHALQKAGIFCAGLAVALGMPALFFNPQLIVGIGLLLAVGILEFTSNRFGLKYLGFGELTLFLLTGPLLSVGLVWPIAGRFDVDVVFLGLIFGLLTAFVYYLKNFEEMVVETRGLQPSLARLVGFDNSRTWPGRIVWLVPVLMVFAGLRWHAWLVVSFFSVFPVWALARAVKSISSCLSSQVGRARRQGIRLHFVCGWIMILCFVSISIYWR